MILAALLGMLSIAVPSEQPLDVREPPFSEFDFAWMNGSNPQPASLLVIGPVTWSIYVDTYYAWQFWRPIDHTIFPTTTAPRHNEISLNLAHLGVDVTGLDGPIGRLYLQYGSMVETIAGQDTTTTRGFFLTNRLFQYVEQAAVGWHFHWMHGANAEVGIFPSYIGLESYLPEENWSYTHAFISDATPYYFLGFRGQLFPTADFKLELWVVNGWQTFGQWHETRGGGYLWNWRPRDWLSIVNSFYGGSEPSGAMGGISFTHRWEWAARWKSSLRVDFLYDETQAISPKFPVGAAYPWMGSNPIAAGGLTATLDYWPSVWLLLRLEYAHRLANQPFFSGRRGITGPDGRLPQDAAAAATFTPDLRRTDDRLVLNMTLRL